MGDWSQTGESMKRREFLQHALRSGLFIGGASLFGCGRQQEVTGVEIGNGIYSPREEVVLYDTYAMALYFDGGLGPKTGIIKVDYILKNEPVPMTFWHGHGGKNHQFTLLPEHYIDFKAQKKTFIQTTIVDGHSHKLFVDFSDPKWRVPGAKPVPVKI